MIKLVTMYTQNALVCKFVYISKVCLCVLDLHNLGAFEELSIPKLSKKLNKKPRWNLVRNSHSVNLDTEQGLYNIDDFLIKVSSKQDCFFSKTREK